MEIIREIFGFIKNLFEWWVTVLPWEQGIRVRFGKYTKVLDAGIHLKIPFIDATLVQCTRTRMHQTMLQTVTTLDNHVISCAVTFGFSILNTLTLVNAISSYEAYLVAKIMGETSKYITSHKLSECSPSLISASILNTLAADEYGIQITNVELTQFAVVKTYRLIQDQSWGLGYEHQTVKI